MKRCCKVMEMAIERGGVSQPFLVLFSPRMARDARENPPPAIYLKGSGRGKDRKAPTNLLLNFCPWCGHDYQDKASKKRVKRKGAA